MFYKVRARLREETAADLLRKLRDGSVASQQPDGPYILESMQRAVVIDSGEIEWSELCFCSPPLAHERETVFDQHFDDMTTEEVEGYQEHAGRSFMDYLEEVSG